MTIQYIEKNKIFIDTTKFYASNFIINIITLMYRVQKLSSLNI